MTGFLSRLIYISEMGRDICVGVKRINDIVHSRILRSHLRKVGCTTATNNQYINIFLTGIQISGGLHCCRWSSDGKGAWITSGVYCYQFHILAFLNRSFHTAT